MSCVCFVMSLYISIPLSREFFETTCDDKTIPHLLTNITYHDKFKLKMAVESNLLHHHSLSPPALVLKQGWQYFYPLPFVFNVCYMLFSIYVPTYLQFISYEVLLIYWYYFTKNLLVVKHIVRP